MPVGEALAIARQIAEALDAAHEKGIVHRDLKPANIVCKARSDASTTCRRRCSTSAWRRRCARGRGGDRRRRRSDTLDGTADGRILGTAAYMSPEQARGQAVDKRTDIWAFGCVLYEMLGGTAARSEATTMTDTLARDPASASPSGPRCRLTTPASMPKVARAMPARKMRKTALARHRAMRGSSSKTAASRPDRPLTLALVPLDLSGQHEDVSGSRGSSRRHRWPLRRRAVALRSTRRTPLVRPHASSTSQSTGEIGTRGRPGVAHLRDLARQSDTSRPSG